MISAFKQPRVKIFQRFSLFLLPGLLTISTTLISCSDQTPNSENQTTGLKTKVVRMGYQSSGDIFRLKGLIEKRLKPLGISVEWAQFAAGPQLMEAMNVGRLILAL
jgi:sulfonate transport system substrate-binding protein